MAARLVSSINTIFQSRGCCSRYFFTVFFDSPTSMARRMRPFGASSLPILSTKAASSAQKPHQVVQNSKSTTFPLMEALVNFSPEVVVAEKCGAGSLSLEAAARPRALTSRTAEKGSSAHGEKIAQNGSEGLGNREWGLGAETAAIGCLVDYAEPSRVGTT